jgi:hypothetical protein
MMMICSGWCLVCQRGIHHLTWSDEGIIPKARMSVSDGNSWVRYENGYVDFGKLDEEGSSSERLSHWVRWEKEPYPRAEEDVLDVISRVLDELALPEEER